MGLDALVSVMVDAQVMDMQELLTSRAEDILCSYKGHCNAGERYGWWRRALGVAVMVLTALVGASLLSLADIPQGTFWMIILGLVSMLAACLSGFQTFLKLDELMASHKLSGDRYLTLYRECQELAALYQAGEIGKEELRDALIEVRTKQDEITGCTPQIPRKDYSRAKEGISKGEGAYAPALACALEKAAPDDRSQAPESSLTSE